MPSTSPPVNSERMRFSDVARLGFAAAHDSPSLKGEGLADLSGTTEMAGSPSNAQGMCGAVQLFSCCQTVNLSCTSVAVVSLIILDLFHCKLSLLRICVFSLIFQLTQVRGV